MRTVAMVILVVIVAVKLWAYMVLAVIALAAPSVWTEMRWPATQSNLTIGRGLAQKPKTVKRADATLAKARTRNSRRLRS